MGQMDDGNTHTYTHGHHDSVLRSHRWRTVENSAPQVIPYLRPGVRLLDVGSGPGTITADFARRLNAGSVTALEATPEAIELTRAEIVANGMKNVEFVVGDIHSTKFDDDTFEIVHAHQVLQHVSDPVGALREMRRICRPDGVVTARDSDYGGFIWYPELPELDAWLELYERAARANGGEPDAGRRLHVWARQAGFSSVDSTSTTWCFTEDVDRGWWGGMWADRILNSKLTTQVLDQGLATKRDLERIAQAWRGWSEDEDGWISIVHGQIICRP